MEEGMNWSAAQYTKFEAERSRPVDDLLARVLNVDARRVADLGCGPGNSTERLRARYPHAEIVGVDRSADMLAAARRRLPNVAFERADIAEWDDRKPFDVILANASLQWVPDHATLLPRLLDKLTTGGSLAVQTPDNFREPAHTLMREVAAAGPWASKLEDAHEALPDRPGPEWYARLLRGRAASMDVWHTTYYHPLAGGASDVVEWFKGSALRPYLKRLEEAERKAFLERYEVAIERAYPALPDGAVLLPFPRLFYVATR